MSLQLTSALLVPREAPFETHLLNKYTLHNNDSCSFMIKLVNHKNRPRVTLYYSQIGSYSVLVVSILVPLNKCTVEIKSFGETQEKVDCERELLFDLTGCQNKGGLTKVSIDELTKNCRIFKSCNPDNSLVVEDMCSGNCSGNRRCLDTDMSCSVVASLVVDSQKDVWCVEDSCSYLLLSVAGCKVLGHFDFRRDTGTSFLDRLELSLGPETKVRLRGQRVYVNDVRVNLNSSEQDFQNVTLFINDNGINLRFMVLRGMLSMVYNGIMVHITAPANEQNRGLCTGGQRSPVMMMMMNRRMDQSEASCQIDFESKPPKPTDCSKEKKLCKTKFAEDPDKIWLKICTKLLCEYGNKDGLLCYIEDLYVLRTGLNVTNTDCVRPDPCLTNYCADNEYCALERGEPECHCLAKLIEDFKQNGRYTVLTDCEDNSVSVKVPVCLFTFKRFDASELHLRDNNCKGQIDEITHEIQFQFTLENNCGATVTNNDSCVIVENNIRNSDDDTALITREDIVDVTFSCFFKHPESEAMTICLDQRTISFDLLMGTFHYTLEQKLCHDYGCDHEMMPGVEQRLGKLMFVRMNVDNLASNLVLVVYSCLGTVRPNNGAALEHPLITHGCSAPEDDTVNVMENGVGPRILFCLKTFQFIRFPRKVELICKVGLCVKKRNNHCNPNCRGNTRGARRRRSVAEAGTEILTSLTWSFEGRDD